MFLVLSGLARINVVSCPFATVTKEERRRGANLFCKLRVTQVKTTGKGCIMRRNILHPRGLLFWYSLKMVSWEEGKRGFVEDRLAILYARKIPKLLITCNALYEQFYSLGTKVCRYLLNYNIKRPRLFKFTFMIILSIRPSNKFSFQYRFFIRRFFVEFESEPK